MAPKRSMKDVKEQWRKQFKKQSFKKKRRAARVKGGIAPREELKYIDLAETGSLMVAAGTVTLLNGIAVGDDNTTRDGRQATMKSVHIRGYAYPDSSTTPQPASLVRAMIVWDNAPNGAAPAVTDIYGGSFLFPVINNAERFTILRDEILPLGRDTNAVTQAVAGAPSIAEWDLYVPLDSVTQYNGTGATIASIQNGALYLVCQGRTGCSYAGTFAGRVRFSDD